MYHIIINPASRSGKGIKIWKEIIEPALIEHDQHKEKILYRSYFSEKAGDVIRLAQEITDASPDLKKLLILGGDGTVNEALQGIRDFSKVALGYIPTGSSNDLARDLKISKKPLEALESILHSGSVRKIDLGTVIYPDGVSRRFAVSCGIGFDAAVCEEAMNSKIKDFFNKLGLGKLTYLGIALRQLISARPVTCEMRLDREEAIHIKKFLFTACMNHRFEGGGFMFCPDADASDGILDLCAVGDIPKPLILLALPTAFFGKHYIINGITPYKARNVHIKTSEPLWIHTDGEVSRRTNEFTVTCEKEVLSVLN